TVRYKYGVRVRGDAGALVNARQVCDLQPRLTRIDRQAAANDVSDCAGSSGALLPPSPPAEKTTARQDQAAHSMRASAQVTAPGAVTSMIVAVSTRPNGQNRSTCSRMSVPLVQNQILRLVNCCRRRCRRSPMAVRPRHDR